MTIRPTIAFDTGETQILPFRVERDGNTFDLTDSQIEWELRQSGQGFLSLDDPGVEIRSRNDTAGEFEIKIDSGATERIPSQTYEELVRIIDAQDNTSIDVGRVRLREVK